MKIVLERKVSAMKNNSLLVSSKEMSDFDNQTIHEGIPSKELMKRAGISIYKFCIENLSKDKLSKILILCGPGNNGGDGLVLARFLIKKGVKPKVFIASAKNYSEDFLFQLRQLKTLNINFYFLDNDNNLKLKNKKKFKSEILNKSNVIVDALLGNSQSQKPRKNIKEIIKIVNDNKNKEQVFLAIDTPTGVNPDSGEVFDDHIKANITLSIQCIKRGLLQYPAKAISGKIKVLDIGIKCKESEFKIANILDYKKVLKRVPNSHKGNFGHVVIVGGSKNMPGASNLAALACIKSGAGKVTKLSCFNEVPIIPEIMLCKLSNNEKSYFDIKLASKAIKFILKTSVLVIGPGLGMNQSTALFLEKILFATKKISKVIDADALNLIAKYYPNKYADLFKNSILTPHPKEMANLLNTSVEAIQNDRYKAVKELSLKTKSCILLKGAQTIVYYNGKGVVINGSNPFLATAGSGDVLSGFIASYIAQNLGVYNAGILGALVHLESANSSIKSKVPIIASDIIESHYKVVRELF